MTDLSGYVLRLTGKRFTAFKNNVSEYGNFAEPVDDFSYSARRPLLVFVLDPRGRLTYLGSGRRGRRAGSGLTRLNIEDLIQIQTRVHANELMAALDKKFAHWVERRLEEGGLLPPKSFEALIDALLEIAPETAPFLARFDRSQRERIARLSPEARTSLAYQKDTVTAAMMIAGMDRSNLSGWTLSEDEEPKSYLEGLPNAIMREDPMVVADFSHVPGYDELKKLPHSASVVFQNEKGETLTVTLANRLPLEQQTGADLIYYNERFKAFIMVQYKAMRIEDSEPRFRFPDKQLNEEVARMEHVLSELAKCPSSPDRDGYRLNSDPFFFKFCPKLQFNPDDTGLMAGIYLPLGYWRSLENDPATLGPRGGRYISYKNVGRYLNNTAFATIVSRAWVGTTIPQSKILTDYILDVTALGRAVTFAVKSDEGDPPDPSVVSVIEPLTDGAKNQPDQVRVYVQEG